MSVLGILKVEYLLSWFREDAALHKALGRASSGVPDPSTTPTF